MPASFKKWHLVGLAATFCAILGGYTFFYFLPNQKLAEARNKLTVKNTPKTALYVSQLDGSTMRSEAETTPLVIGVMIDNHPDARPQSGISDARVVYEAPAEGGITRYMAIFPAGFSKSKVGPVRSARPYFMDFLGEYGHAVYMHVGGSPLALEELKISSSLVDTNQFFYDRYFWRDTGRDAPHNVYTSSELWNKFVAAHNVSTKAWVGWKFGALASPTTSAVTAITIPYTQSYSAGWTYDAATKKYTRNLNGKTLTDEEGAVVTADNVIVQFVSMKTVDDEGRKDIITTGQGQARVLRGGIMVNGMWKKDGPRTRLYDSGGKEIALTPGQTWVQVVPSEITLEISN